MSYLRDSTSNSISFNSSYTDEYDSNEIEDFMNTLTISKDSKEVAGLKNELLKQSGNLSEEDAGIIAQTAVLTAKQFTEETTHISRKKYKLTHSFSIKEKNCYIHNKAKYGSSKIGNGSFKETYKAVRYNSSDDLTECVAHQILRDPIHFEMAKSEIELQQSFDHPNIVKVYDIIFYSSDSMDTKLNIYVKLCDGSMEDIIKNPTKYSIKEKAQIAYETADALEYMHKKGFSHNDLKPDNILIKNRHAKVSDFGVSGPIGKNPKHRLAKTQAPEQKKKSTRAGCPATDAYQYGLTLLQLFHPQPDKNHLEDSYRFDTTDPFKNWPIKTDNDRALQSLIGTCLSTDPLKRPSMAQIKNTLATVK